MEPDRFIEHALRLAAAAPELPKDAEDRIAAMGLEPTLRDRTLLLIDQTRMLAGRSGDRDGQQAVVAAPDEDLRRWVEHAHHELRQPLAVIRAVIETLAAHHTRLDAATLATLVQRVRRQSVVMEQVVDHLGRATAVGAGPLEVAPQPTDLGPLVAQLSEDHGPLLGDIAITYRRPPRAVIACVEPSAATQILLVLVRNAADHAPCEAPILIETVPGEGTVRVSVHDDGDGVPAADRERIFAYGTRLDTAGSFGLGLFIARRLARAHGGDLAVADSRRLGGARFDLTLPTDCGPTDRGPTGR